MKLAFCLYRYFPFGGLQRDFIRIARLCLQHGHEVIVYTGAWEGEPEPGLRVKILPVSGWQNHTRCRSFARALAQQLAQQTYDVIVGFNKMPGLDVYYAADICYQARLKKTKPFWYSWLPRYRHYLQDEGAVFSLQSGVKILTLAEQQQAEYQTCYRLPRERFHLLPPGISPDRKAPPQAKLIREALRSAHAVPVDTLVLLLVGSGFKTKGLDRVLRGIAALPPDLKHKTRLWVVGQDNPTVFLKQAKALGISSQLYFFGGRHDVADFFLAADLLVHPAYHENTGTVILEALVAGLPVLTVETCGYAPYVESAKAGIVLSGPYAQNQFNHALQKMLISPNQAAWKKNALAFAATADIYSLPEKAVRLLENLIPDPLAKKAFDYYMQLRGDCYREQRGRRTQQLILNQQTYFIKQHFGVGWKEIFKNLLQFKLPILSAKKEWQAIQRLQALSILTPTIRAYGSRGFNPARLQSFLLMEAVKPAISLEDFCRHWKQQTPPFSLKLALIHKLASIAKIMHENGIHHRDFYLCHFLLDPQSITKALDQLKLYLIDLHRAGRHQTANSRWIIKDLAGLYFSSKERGLSKRDYWRFIKSYRQRPLRDIIRKEKKFWQQVILRGEKLYHAHAS